VSLLHSEPLLPLAMTADFLASVNFLALTLKKQNPQRVMTTRRNYTLPKEADNAKTPKRTPPNTP
jgi:hypothetical protein